jgi:hypothetical protein
MIFHSVLFGGSGIYTYIVADRANVTTKLVFKDHSEFQKTLTDGRFIDQSDIVYIAQGELERYIGEKSDLDKYIRELIFESPQVKNTVKAFEFEELAKKMHEYESGLTQTHQAIETYKKTALNRLSLGQKATVLIKIYLAQGSHPIVVDSHDDHLDNEFIMQELVGAIRRPSPRGATLTPH